MKKARKRAKALPREKGGGLARGTRGQLKGRDSSGGSKSVPPEKPTPSLSSMGIDKHLADRARKKRGRGRPRKNGGGRVFTAAHLPPELVEHLDAFVKHLRTKTRGASRGDVLAAALRRYPPFRRWLEKRP